MKFCTLVKDGGEESHVWAYVLIEIKWLFSIMLLRFEDGSRDAFHSHAFNCVSWVLRGRLTEHHLPEFHRGVYLSRVTPHEPSWRPVLTYRSTFHRVVSTGRTWVLTFRGPWAKTWEEFIPNGLRGRFVTLTHGRKEV